MSDFLLGSESFGIFLAGFRKQRLARTKSENWWPPTGTSRGIKRAEGKFLEEMAAWKR